MRRFLCSCLALVILFQFPVFSANTPKSGASCLKAGQTQNYQGKKYTCIKSGKRLIWDKGIFVVSPTPALTPTPSPTPTSTPTPTPISTPTSIPSLTPVANEADNLTGKSCSNENEIIVNSSGEYWCQKQSGILRWEKNNPTPSSVASPYGGSNCPKLGTRETNSLGYRECRMVKGKVLQWVQLSPTPPAFINPQSAENVAVCKLKGHYRGNALTGFGLDVTNEGNEGIHINKRINPAIGSNDALIVPLDFPDLIGDENISSVIDDNRKSFLKWIDYFSDGKLKMNLDSINHWIRMPSNSSRYNLPDFVGENENSYTQSGSTKIAQLYINEITKYVDLTKYRTIFIIYPHKHDSLLLDLVPRSVEFQLKDGKRTMSLFADPAGYDSDIATPLWAFWAHEIGHDWGLLGHVPNGWFIGLMENQGGISLSLNAWERFVLTWMPDELVYCDTKENLKTATVKLSALERADRQTKMIAIKLDDHRLLVVEAHGIGEWTSLRPEQNNYLKYDFKNNPYYSIMVYIVDTEFNPLDKPILTNPDGTAFSSDDGVTTLLPRYAYIQPVDGGRGSNDYQLYFGSNKNVDYSAYMGVQGDSFTIEGVKIKLANTGDYESIEISKSSN